MREKLKRAFVFAESRIFWVNLCRKQYAGAHPHLTPKYSEISKTMEIMASTPFKVIQGYHFGTSRKPICELHSVTHRFQDIADYWSNFKRRHGMSVFNVLVRGEPIHLELPNLASTN